MRAGCLPDGWWLLQVGSQCVPGSSNPPDPAPTYSGCATGINCGNGCIALCRAVFSASNPYATNRAGGTGTFTRSTCNAGDVSRYECSSGFNCCACKVTCSTSDTCPSGSTCTNSVCTPPSSSSRSA